MLYSAADYRTDLRTDFHTDLRADNIESIYKPEHRADLRADNIESNICAFNFRSKFRTINLSTDSPLHRPLYAHLAHRE